MLLASPPPPRSSSAQRSAVAFAMIVPVAATIVSSAAHAGCPVKLTSSGASSAWSQAIDRENERLRATRAPQQDCRSIEIDVQADGVAVLRFTTVDGREAKRTIADPSELTSSIDALLVTLAPLDLPSASAAASASGSVSTAASSTSASSAPTARRRVGFGDDPNDPLSRAPQSAIYFGARAGARESLGRHLLSPVLEANAGATRGTWDLGLGLEWAPVTTRWSAKEPTGFAMTSVVVRGELGQRIALKRWAFVGGGSLAMAWVHETATTPAGASTPSDEQRIQPRLGIYAGLVYPRDTKVRFRFDARADAALSGVSRTHTEENLLVAFPRFGSVMTVGFEAALL